MTTVPCDSPFVAETIVGELCGPGILSTCNGSDEPLVARFWLGDVEVATWSRESLTLTIHKDTTDGPKA